VDRSIVRWSRHVSCVGLARGPSPRGGHKGRAGHVVFRDVLKVAHLVGPRARRRWCGRERHRRCRDTQVVLTWENEFRWLLNGSAWVVGSWTRNCIWIRLHLSFRRGLEAGKRNFGALMEELIVYFIMSRCGTFLASDRSITSLFVCDLKAALAVTLLVFPGLYLSTS